jgi:hypothetical protein
MALLEEAFDLALQSGALAWNANQAALAEIEPDLVVDPLLGRVLLAGPDGGSVTLRHLGVGLVGIEEGAAIGSVLVNRALALEMPVTAATGSTGGDENGIGLIRQGPQVFLGPGKEILAWRTEPIEILGIEPARDVPAGDATEDTIAHGPGEAMPLSHWWISFCLVVTHASRPS